MSNKMEAKVLTCWYKNLTKNTAVAVCKAVVGKRIRNFMYYKPLSKEQAYKLVSAAKGAETLSRNLWEEIA